MMRSKNSIVRYCFASVFLAVTVLPNAIVGQRILVEFGPESWDMANAQVVTRFGRECVTGAAFLRDVEFENGVIEV